MRVARLAALLGLLSYAPALAAPPLIGNIIGKQAYHGPGSRGFEAACASDFSVTNSLLNSNTFSSWTANTSAGITAVVTSGATDPLGGTTASSIAFSTVTGAGKLGVINETTSSIGSFPLSFNFWAKVTAGSGNGTIYGALSVGTTFANAPIPSDGLWHRITVNVTPDVFTNVQNPIAQIGINLNDTAQAASTGAITVSVWQASIITNPIAPYISAANVAGPLATTSGAVTATINIPCPPGIAFRKFSPLLPAKSNPILSENTNEVWQAGGVTNAISGSRPFWANGFYWAFADSIPTLDRISWPSFSLFKSRNGLSWTEDTTNAPYLQIAGSIFANPTITTAGAGYSASASGTMTWAGSGCPVPPVLNVGTNPSGAITTASYASGSCTTWPTAGGTTWTPSGIGTPSTPAAFSFAMVRGTGTISLWQRHAAFLPHGCTISSSFHPFCVVYSGGTTSFGSFNVYMAWSDTINGVYTPVGCTGPGTCASPTQMLASNSHLPTSIGASQGSISTVNVGGASGINYLVTAFSQNGGTTIPLWTTPGTPVGANLTWAGIALSAVPSTSWDTGATFTDPMIVRNKCGFYELFYTAKKAAGFFSTTIQQVIGVAIGPSPMGPFWRAAAPVIPVTSSLYFGTNFIGNSSIMVVGGQEVWTGNYNNATTQWRAVAATMQDACSY